MILLSYIRLRPKGFEPSLCFWWLIFTSAALAEKYKKVDQNILSGEEHRIEEDSGLRWIGNMAWK